jgi:hypothetical protein
MPRCARGRRCRVSLGGGCRSVRAISGEARLATGLATPVPRRAPRSRSSRGRILSPHSWMLTPKFHGAAVVPNRNLHGEDVPAAADPADLKVDIRWVVPPPLAEVRDALEALTGLRELQDRVPEVDLVRPILVAGRAAAEVVLQRSPSAFLIQVLQPSRCPGAALRSASGPCGSEPGRGRAVRASKGNRRRAHGHRAFALGGDRCSWSHCRTRDSAAVRAGRPTHAAKRLIRPPAKRLICPCRCARGARLRGGARGTRTRGATALVGRHS